jgi:hypothetical protein
MSESIAGHKAHGLSKATGRITEDFVTAMQIQGIRQSHRGYEA